MTYILNKSFIVTSWILHQLTPWSIPQVWQSHITWKAQSFPYFCQQIVSQGKSHSQQTDVQTTECQWFIREDFLLLWFIILECTVTAFQIRQQVSYWLIIERRTLQIDQLILQNGLLILHSLDSIFDWRWQN